MTACAPDRGDVYAALSDGSVAHVRDLGPHDLPALQQLLNEVSDRSVYLRFFGPSRPAALRFSTSLARPATPSHCSIGAFQGARLLGVADFELTAPATAEIAVLVTDDHHHTGIGTLLIEHLIGAARRAGIRRFSAEVLTQNAPMNKVLRDLGFETRLHFDRDVVDVSFDLDATEAFVAAVTERDRRAGAASLQPLLAPRSVAVVGAGRRTDSVGTAVLRNLRRAGFGGRLYAVNSAGVSACGIDGVRSPAELPEPVDLAVIAVPAPAVVDVARSCGDRGVRALAVLSAGFAEAGPDGAARQDELLAVVREHGMRLLGPNCIGLVNNDPAVRLDATFADLPHRGGSFAVLTQSGAFGVGVLEAADELGLGVSRFVSIGDKADVGGNDLLLAWGDDPDVEVIGMYLESVGDPLRFARIARSVTRRKPIIAVKSGTTEAGRRAGRSHTAAAASPDVAVDALFHAAGVTRVATTAELLDLARVLTTQPALRGPRVAIVGNSGGPQILAADAAERAGLDVVGFGPTIEERLRRLGVAPTNPLDLGAGATADTMAAVLGAITTSDRVDAVITVFTRLATTDADRVRTEVCAAADRCAVPILAVEIGAPAGVVRGASGTRHVPIFSFAEPAAAALGLAYRCTRSRSAADAAPIPPAGVDRSAARVLVDTAMATGGEWLDAASTADLLRAYRIPVSRFALATSGDEAVARAEALGYPVAVKLADPRVHKSDVGGVRLDLRNGEEVRTAAGVLLRLCPPEHRQLLVQPMTREGTELIVGAVHDRTFGPLVMLGAGGVLTDIAQDRAFRIAPLSELDAESLVRELRTSRLLDGYRGAPVVPRSLVLDLVVRVAAMVSDLPEIAELDLNPVICRADGLVVVDARVRVAAPPRHPDPLVRQLRSSPTA